MPAIRAILDVRIMLPDGGAEIPNARAGWGRAIDEGWGRWAGCLLIDRGANGGAGNAQCDRGTDPVSVVVVLVAAVAVAAVVVPVGKCGLGCAGK